MPFVPATAETPKLDAMLDRYGVGFLKGSLAKINGIDELANGVLGEAIIAELGRMKKKGVSEKTIVSKATEAFEIFSGLRSDFNKKYNEDKYADTLSKKACVLASAYAFAIINSGMAYSKGSGGAEYEVLDGVIKRAIDCNVSAYLLIHLAREKGFDMAGVLLPNHYVAALMENDGQVARYFETITPLEYVERHKKEHNTGAAMFYNFLDDGWLWTLILQKEEWEQKNRIFALDKDATTTSVVNFHAWDLFGMWKKVDREKYEKYKDILKNKWMLDRQNFMAFANYALYMMAASDGFPFIKVDNEKELFDALKQAEKIFGKEKLDKLKLWEKSRMTPMKIYNPVDYVRSEFF